MLATLYAFQQETKQAVLKSHLLTRKRKKKILKCPQFFKVHRAENKFSFSKQSYMACPNSTHYSLGLAQLGLLLVGRKMTFF